MPYKCNDVFEHKKDLWSWLMADVVMADFFNAIILHFLFNCTVFKCPFELVHPG